MYIDPNTGGMLATVLIGIFGVVSAVVLVFSSKIKMGIAKLRRSMRKESEETEPTETKTK
jgi:hypothetical protein